MSGDELNDRVKQLLERSAISKSRVEKISLHSLRHSIATHLADNGAGIEFIQQFLGHASIDTTHLYSRRRKSKLVVMDQMQNVRL